MTAAQADALSVLAQAGPLSLKELGELLIAEAGHPSRLVEAGLVEGRPTEDDRRKIVLLLTPPGRRLEKRAEKVRQVSSTSSGNSWGIATSRPSWRSSTRYCGPRRTRS